MNSVIQWNLWQIFPTFFALRQNPRLNPTRVAIALTCLYALHGGQNPFYDERNFTFVTTSLFQIMDLGQSNLAESVETGVDASQAYGAEHHLDKWSLGVAGVS